MIAKLKFTQELKRLVKQIKATYSLTVNRPHPLSTLTLTGLEPGGRIEQALQKYAYGFDECLVRWSSCYNHSIISVALKL